MSLIGYKLPNLKSKAALCRGDSALLKSRRTLRALFFLMMLEQELAAHFSGTTIHATSVAFQSCLLMVPLTALIRGI